MADLKDLYQDIVLDHYRKPRNRKMPQNYNRRAEALNPLCGDKFTVYLKIEDGVIQDICFDGTGCAISIASASMMTEILRDKTADEAVNIHDIFRSLLTDSGEAPADPRIIESLSAFSSVKNYPVRIKCVMLAWQALVEAISQDCASIR